MYPCAITGDPSRAAADHDNLIEYVKELYSGQGIRPAKPLFECGQGLPVHAAGNEIRTGQEGVTTSEWGNQVFVDAVKKVAKDLFPNAGSDLSKLGDKVESIFDISFGVRVQAIGWGWLRITPAKERQADELVVALE